MLTRLGSTAALVIALSSFVSASDRVFPQLARATSVIFNEAGGPFGFSPLPTQAPVGPPADHGLERRDDAESGTCGYVSGFDSNPWTCYATDATCSVWNDHMGCCVPGGGCSSTVLTSCIDWTAVQSGACGSTSDSRTLCCTDSFPSCWTWLSTADNSDNTVTGFNCLASAGTGTLLATPPSALTTDNSGTATTDESITTAEDTGSASTGSASSGSSTGSSDGSSSSSSSSGSSSNNGGTSSTAVIVGGVVGGLALIALIVIAAGVILWRRRKDRREREAAAAAATAAADNGHNQSPHQQMSYVGSPSLPANGYDGRTGMMPPPHGDPYYNAYYSSMGPAGGNTGPQYDPSKASPSMHTNSMYGSQSPFQQGPWPVSQHNTGASVSPQHHMSNVGPQELSSAPAVQVGTHHNRAELS